MLLGCACVCTNTYVGTMYCVYLNICAFKLFYVPMKTHVHIPFSVCEEAEAKAEGFGKGTMVTMATHRSEWRSTCMLS